MQIRNQDSLADQNNLLIIPVHLLFPSECREMAAIDTNKMNTMKRSGGAAQDAAQPPAKRRVLTLARREQNRLAQKAYSELMSTE